MRHPEKITLPNGRVFWQLRLPKPGGGMRYKRFGTMKLAERSAREAQAQKEVGIDPGARCSVRELVAKWKASPRYKDLSPSAQADYEKSIDRLLGQFGDRELRSITTVELQAFCTSVIDGVTARSPKRSGVRTHNKTVATLKLLWARAVAWRLVAFNAASTLERRKPVRTESEDADFIDSSVFTPDEIGQLLTAAADEDDRLAIRFLFMTGVRISELAGLRWADCEFASNRVFIRNQIGDAGALARLKTPSARRTIDLDADLMHRLKLKKLRAGSNEFVFGNSTGGAMDRDNFRRRVWSAALRRAGLRHIRLHDARHAHASLLLAAGADIVAVSRRLGHKDPSITLRIYAHLVRLRDQPALGDLVAKASGCFLVGGGAAGSSKTA